VVATQTHTLGELILRETQARPDGFQSVWIADLREGLRAWSRTVVEVSRQLRGPLFPPPKVELVNLSQDGFKLSKHPP